MIISGVLAYRNDVTAIDYQSLLAATIFTLLVGILIGTYSLQIGIRKSEPITVSFIIYIAPIVTAAFEILDSRIGYFDALVCVHCTANNLSVSYVACCLQREKFRL